MDHETLRRKVWGEMLEASMRANYFGEFVVRYQRFEKLMRIFVFVASSGSAAAALTHAPTWISVAFPLIAVVASGWLVFSQYSVLARDSADLHSGWLAQERDYERLWNHIDEHGAEATYDEIYGRGEGLSKTGTRFPKDDKRLAYWLDHASERAMARYA